MLRIRRDQVTIFTSIQEQRLIRSAVSYAHAEFPNLARSVGDDSLGSSIRKVFEKARADGFRSEQELICVLDLRCRASMIPALECPEWMADILSDQQLETKHRIAIARHALCLRLVEERSNG